MGNVLHSVGSLFEPLLTWIRVVGADARELATGKRADDISLTVDAKTCGLGLGLAGGTDSPSKGVHGCCFGVLWRRS